MGEWSRKVGEIGENVVEDFLEMIGWDQCQRGVPIPCIEGKSHKLTDKDRTTHGADFLLSTRSNLIDQRIVHLVISVKYSSKPYPSKGTAVSTLKKHLEDLAQTVHCFRRSAVKQAQEKSQTGIRSAENVGVLFWLTALPADDVGIIDKIAASEINASYKFDSICVLDNRNAAFIYDSVDFIRNAHKGQLIEFYYFNTGKNVNGKERSISGPVLPVQYMNSDVLPFRIEDPGAKATVLALCLNAPFSAADMRRMLALAQGLCSSWAGAIELYFSKYDPQTDENEVKMICAGFADRKTVNKLTVNTFRPDFRSHP